MMEASALFAKAPTLVVAFFSNLSLISNLFQNFNFVPQKENTKSSKTRLRQSFAFNPRKSLKHFFPKSARKFLKTFSKT